MQYTQYPDRQTDRQPAASWQANWADSAEKKQERSSREEQLEGAGRSRRIRAEEGPRNAWRATNTLAYRECEMGQDASYAFHLHKSTF